MKNRVQRLPLFCLAVTLCLSACSKTDSEQQSASVPFGTYVYTYEDGSTSQITVDAHTSGSRMGTIPPALRLQLPAVSLLRQQK